MREPDALSEAGTEIRHRFRKARRVLTSPDPSYREKLREITRVLSNLQDNEKFFSIDERVTTLRAFLSVAFAQQQPVAPLCLNGAARPLRTGTSDANGSGSWLVASGLRIFDAFASFSTCFSIVPRPCRPVPVGPVPVGVREVREVSGEPTGLQRSETPETGEPEARRQMGSGK